MEGLTPGRNVHYVMPTGEHRPAIVVRVEPEATTVNLVVFTDGQNDASILEANYPVGASYIAAVRTGILWRSSIPFDEENKVPDTWHWIERA